MTDVKKGQILRLTFGCYSDWTIYAELLVLQDFNVSASAVEYGKDHPEAGKRWWDDEFSKWLADRGLVSLELPQEIVEVHTGDYDNEAFFKTGEAD